MSLEPDFAGCTLMIGVAAIRAFFVGSMLPEQLKPLITVVVAVI